MKTWMRFVIVVAVNVAVTASSFASLLNATLTFPKISCRSRFRWITPVLWWAVRLVMVARIWFYPEQ